MISVVCCFHVFVVIVLIFLKHELSQVCDLCIYRSLRRYHRSSVKRYLRAILLHSNSFIVVRERTVLVHKEFAVETVVSTVDSRDDPISPYSKVPAP